MITGGSSGLGLAMARRLAAEGWRLILVARDAGRLEAAAAGLRERGAEVLVRVADVSSRRDVAALAESVGPIDLLVLNAAVVEPGTLAERSGLDGLEAEVRIDLWGVILCTKLLLPRLARGARLLIVSSGFGLVGAAGYATYGASKAGLIRFAESMRRELRGDGIRVQVACPGDMDTPQYRRELRLAPDWMHGNALTRLVRGAPADPERVAGSILRQAEGRGFLIVSDPGLRLFLVAQHLLPRFLLDLVLDRLFPLPPPIARSMGRGELSPE